ncbi:hypothetical protein [Treponema parvum]|uniref:hypothetical protein n=1 Tax=Treponema parvum TaxID=138851 RepID=UPI001AEBCC52|nr:hypothetical protein [Treponema parvum]QTQ16291.1 hypothetical protein HXT04_06085 [Treponema parvum]
MDNDEIKKALSKLYDCKTDFTVIMTGKKSSRVNGLYKRNTCEILLNNRNFKTQNELMYTAVHELTHHVLTTEKGVKSAKSHSGIFWATFYDLLDKAIENGFYSRTRSDETKALIDEAKEIQKSLIELQKRLGAVITKIHGSCIKNGERIEDVIEHDLQMTRNKAHELQKIQGSDNDNSDEIIKAVNFASDPMIKAAAQQAADNGATVQQVKAIAQQKVKATDDDLENPEQLRREKKRLESTIARLSDRLVQVEETLLSMEGGE